MNTIRICFMLVWISILLVIPINSQRAEYFNSLNSNSFLICNSLKTTDSFLIHKNNEFIELLKMNKKLSDTKFVIDSVMAMGIDDNIIYKYSYTYNNSGNMTLSVMEYFNNSQWITDRRDIYEYDLVGNRTLWLREHWTGLKWVKIMQETYTYDSNGNMTLYAFENWVSNSGSISSGRQEHYFYTENGNISLCISKYWEGGQWVTKSLNTYNYDLEDNMTLLLIENWDGSQWVNNWREVNTYDSIGNMILCDWEFWDGNKWISDYRISYTFNSNNNMILSEWETWDNSLWTNLYRLSYTHDINNNLTLCFFELWEENKWSNFERTTYMYDNYGKWIGLTHERWENSKWILGNIGGFSGWDYTDSYGNIFNFHGAKLELSYKTLTDIENDNILISDFSLSQNYPNPFNPSTTIKYSIPKQSNITLKVFDVLGSEVATLVNKEQPKGNYEIEFDGSELTSGIYFYRLRADDFIETKKMIMLK